MADHIDALLVRMPEIARAVNAFDFPDVQARAFEVLMEAVGIEPPAGTVDSPPPSKAPKKRAAAKKGSTRKRTVPASKAADKKGSAESGAKKAPKNSSGRPGPEVAVTDLLEAGFFVKPKTQAQLIEELKLKKGFTYTGSDMSPTLLRMLRNGDLQREKNADGNYEFRV